MRNKIYLDYLQSNEWAQIRIDLFELRGKKCERCGSKKRISVHHLSYDNIFNEEPEDLEILCDKCHKNEHGLIVKVKKKKYSKRIKKSKPVVENKHRWYNLRPLN